MTKFPTEILVRGHKYVIKYVASTREVSTNLDSDNYIGYVSHKLHGSGEIRILSNQNPIGVLDTLIHEILHAIFRRNPLLLASIKPEVGDEAVVDTLGSELADFLIANNLIKLPNKILPTETRIND